MKYISLLVFTAALAWSWNVIHGDVAISFETHAAIQEKLATVIADSVKARKPNASDILIEKIWTEVISEKKVKAFFIYSFKDSTESGVVSSQIKGQGFLERQSTDDPTVDKWVLTQVRTSSDAIEFVDSTIITGSPEGSPDIPDTENLPLETEKPSESP